MSWRSHAGVRSTALAARTAVTARWDGTSSSGSSLFGARSERGREGDDDPVAEGGDHEAPEPRVGRLQLEVVAEDGREDGPRHHRHQPLVEQLDLLGPELVGDHA